jgi:hypothetical protein
MEDQEIKTPAKTLVDADASSRLTIVLDGLGDSTPAPAQFRTKPLATGASGYSWAARVDKLTERLDKLQLRVESLEDSFEDPDDPTQDELDKLATLQRARESLLVELRAAKEQLSGPSSRGASPKRDAAEVAPSVTTVAKVPAAPKYPPYPSDVAHPPFTREVEDVPRWMRAAAIWFSQESSPPVPDEATRLRLLTGAMGSQDLKLAYANWLSASGGAASWDKAQSFLLTQVPWRDLPVQAMHSILSYPEMKVRDGKTLSNNLISYITGFQNALANHGMDTTLPVSAAFQDRLRSDGSPTEAFTLLDRFLAQLLLGKLAAEVRTVYLAQRASEATAHFKSTGAYLPETLTSMFASLARLHFPSQAPTQVFKTGGGGTTFAAVAKGEAGGGGGGCIRAGRGGRGGRGGRQYGRTDSRAASPHPGSSAEAPTRGPGGCFHCGERGHYSKICPKLNAAGITTAQFEQLQGPGHAKQAARQALDAHKRAVTLHSISHPGGQSTNATQELRNQLEVLSDGYNKLFNQFTRANRRLDSSEAGSSE